MKKVEFAKKVVVGGMVVASMVGSIPVTSFADTKVPSSIVTEVKSDSKKMAKESFFSTGKAKKAIKKSNVIEDMVEANDVNITKAYDSALRCALIGSNMSDDMGISRDTNKKMCNYLVKLNAYYIAKSEGKKATMPKLDKKTLTNMHDLTDVLLAQYLVDNYQSETDSVTMEFLSNYTNSIRRDRLKRTNGDKICGMYLDVVNMFENGSDRGSNKQHKTLYNKYKTDAIKGVKALSPVNK